MAPPVFKARFPTKVKLAFLAIIIVEPISASAPPFTPTLLENVAVPSMFMILEVTVSAVEGLCEKLLLLIVKSTLNKIMVLLLKLHLIILMFLYNMISELDTVDNLEPCSVKPNITISFGVESITDIFSSIVLFDKS